MKCGISVTQEVKDLYKKEVQPRKNTKAGFVIKINEKDEIEIEKTFDDPKTFDIEEDLKSLPTDDSRIIVLNYHFTKEGSNADMSELLAILWCPSSLPGKKKMKYSTSFKGIIQQLPALKIDIQADCLGDITKEKIIKKLS